MLTKLGIPNELKIIVYTKFKQTDILIYYYWSIKLS
jgi:hypothetical protein